MRASTESFSSLLHRQVVKLYLIFIWDVMGALCVRHLHHKPLMLSLIGKKVAENQYVTAGLYQYWYTLYCTVGSLIPRGRGCHDDDYCFQTQEHLLTKSTNRALQE